jgi:hypothetical protein
MTPRDRRIGRLQTSLFELRLSNPMRERAEPPVKPSPT